MEGFIVFSIFIIICLSMMQYVLAKKKRNESKIALEVFFSLCIIYCTVMIGFAIIYFVCARKYLVLDSLLPGGLSIGESLYECLYFSGVTMLTIGYGDIVPVGLGRVIALIQALIGYILPTAFVLKVMQMKA